MKEILQYLENNKELVNTLINSLIGFLGVIVGSFLTIILNNIGKLRIFSKNLKISSYNQDEYGTVTECELDDPKKIFSDIQITIDFINEKSINKILRDIKFFIKNKNQDIFFELYEKDTVNKKLESLIIDPKSFKSLVLYNQVDDDLINILDTNNKIYFSYRNGKNKLKIIKLT